MHCSSVISYATPNVSILGPRRYRSTCLTMRGGTTSIQRYLPQCCVKYKVFMVLCRTPSSAIICQCRWINAHSLALSVCLPYNACPCIIHSLIFPSVLGQKHVLCLSRSVRAVLSCAGHAVSILSLHIYWGSQPFNACQCNMHLPISSSILCEKLCSSGHLKVW